MAVARIAVVGVALSLFLYWFLFPLDPFLVDASALEGKRVVITGASLGIGKSLAFEYARRNVSHLVLVSRSLQGLQKVKNDIYEMSEDKDLRSKLKIEVVSADLSNELACKTVINQAVELMGGIDYLVLNHVTRSILDNWLDIKDHFAYMEDTFRVNTFSYVYLATMAIEELKKSSGQIVVVSSLAGHVGTPKTSIYSSAKHALHGFFDGFRNELLMSGYENIGITLCAIGSTDTEGATTFKKRITSVTWDPPEDAARAIVNGGALRRRDIFHPQYIVYPSKLVDSLFPQALDWILRLNLKDA